MSYKRPESVLVVVYTKTAEVLLMHRSDVPHFWQSVTGSLQADETPLATARREVWEETGIVATDEQLHDGQYSNRFPIILPWRTRYAPEVTHNTEYVFSLWLPVACPIQLNPLEHCDYRWLPWQEALKLASSYTNQAAILNIYN
ncbi:MAG: dihydroneopterin triphosphate diphosphatase [Beggiatoa sp. IS2]|nr:MAG: dihydroneopterin triphosphate diphosphatase [Beggiatoa sp. IS2]